jgi:hypothetical protein
MTDKVQKILREIATRKLCTMDEHMAFYNDKAKEEYILLSDIEEFIKDLQEEPVSEDLEKAAKDYSNNLDNIYGSIGEQTRNAFKAGAKWQKEEVVAKAADATIGVPYHNNRGGGYIHLVDVSKPLPVGNNKIAIICEEE